MKKTAIFIALCVLFLHCKNDGKKSSQFGRRNPEDVEKQVFKIKTGQDIIIKTKSGTAIQIFSNTFLNSTNQKAELIVQEITSKKDMIAYGISTVSSDGKLLESGGIVKLSTNPTLAINPERPINIKIPTNGAATGMKVFSSEFSGGQMIWKYESELANASDFGHLERGEKLFYQYCKICHAKDQVTTLTGPPLGCLEMGPERRSRDWLIRFTQNSQKMIYYGDTLANCLWAMWKPCLMPSFEYLTNEEIGNIYDYIHNESVRMSLCYDRETSSKSNMMKLTCNTDSLEILNDTTFLIETASIYDLLTKELEWINCDRFIDTDKDVDAFDVKTSEEVFMYLIFKHRKTICPFVKSEERYILQYSESQSKLNLPIGEKITILAFTKEQDGKRKYVAIHERIKKENNDYELKLEDISEDDFQKLMDKL